MRVQSVLDSEDAFSESVEDRFAFEKKARVSGESFDITSISYKRGAERFFDITHHTVVLVDKGSPFLVAQRHENSRGIP